MTSPLAKVLHLAPTASSRAADLEPGIPGPRKASKRRRWWLLSALMAPPLVMALSLAGTGIANASALSTYSGYGPTISVGGGLQETTNWSAAVTCDVTHHQLTIQATAFPVTTGESVFEQVYLYSYQTRTGNWGPANYAEFLNGQAQYAPGYYYVYVYFGWYTPAGWQTWGPVAIGSYTQLGTTIYHDGVDSQSCRL